MSKTKLICGWQELKWGKWIGRVASKKGNVSLRVIKCSKIDFGNDLTDLNRINSTDFYSFK